MHNKNAARSGFRHTPDSLMRYAERLGYGAIHTKFDAKTGLKAIIAIHNLNRGPAIGGCRMIPYKSIADAYEDVLRLGYMMSYKAAITDLPHGGAKAVIIRPKIIHNRKAFFEKFGEFVNELGGRYITAVDSGTNISDMDIIAKRTPYVTCTSHSGNSDDPSPLTALGVRRAIEAAVKFKLGKDSLEGIHIAIQGIGHVGWDLARQLKERGAILTLTDVNQQALEQCREELQARVVASEEIYDVHADVFAPCALGKVLNLSTIQRLNAKIVAGAANNQLAHHHYGALLHERGILYAPDFLINAGGLIHVAVLYAKEGTEKSLEKINAIYEKVYAIFERAAQENRATSEIAEEMAKEKLGI